jgi:hypothetical protein
MNVKRFLVVLAAAAVAGVIYVAAAPGGQTATPTAKQFAALKKQVSLLSKKVKAQGAAISALKTAEKGVKTEADDAVGFITNCLIAGQALPINQFGDANGTFGYAYTATAGAQPTSRTALDVDTAATPGAFLQGVAPSCISSGALRKTGGLTERRATIQAAAKR